MSLSLSTKHKDFFLNVCIFWNDLYEVFDASACEPIEFVFEEGGGGE